MAEGKLKQRIGKMVRSVADLTIVERSSIKLGDSGMKVLSFGSIGLMVTVMSGEGTVLSQELLRRYTGTSEKDMLD